ncbi:phosphotransferase [Plantactinospora soyae]|uniref:Aminoglycoside phosphotransferase (APT) family kinase protein n=1 Tax=Plantactinospora soyae TaxID=1544732 RepID=A0A927R7N4_9ACTN|nr:phosphotransferase [Plantactinospora soyae]MBE1489629.1 aminoglycoside phosphotransferase (APT) family kinase protein [Plantactinospora soyae]
MSGDEPELLSGGFVNVVVRVGDTVRRPVSPSSGFVRDVLGFLEHCQWPGAPRHLGFDDQGREVLTFLAGHVAWEKAQPAEVRSDQGLVAVSRLVRQLHDLTAGSDLAGDQEVVCHNDLSPRNTVYRDLGDGLHPVAFIDWDLAAPGSRVHDVAHVCWQYVGLGPGVDIAEAARLVRLIADAYGLLARGELIRTILWWQDRCWRGIATAAAAGEPAMVRLCALGVVNEVRAAYQWTAEQRLALERAML